MKLKLALMLALFAALAAMFLTLPGCANTPQQRYDTDSGLWALAHTGATIAEVSGKLTPAQIQIVNANLANGDGNLAAAQIWLTANPVLAQTPGYQGPPTLSAFNVFISALNASIVPSVLPATKPSTASPTPGTSETKNDARRTASQGQGLGLSRRVLLAGRF